MREILCSLIGAKLFQISSQLIIHFFLRYPLGVWAYEKDKTLVHLFYDHDLNLIDKRPAEFNTVVACKPPGLPAPAPPDLADWSCTLDPYLAVKGSALAVEHLVLKDRHPQPST